MTLARWTGLVQDGAGNAVAGAQIEVRSEQTGRLVSLFADREGQTRLGNPFTAPEATVAFHAAGDALRITASKGGLLSEWRYVALGTAAEYDVDGLVFALQAGVYPAMTLAQLQEFDPGEDGVIAGVVYNDPDPALNGYYRRGNDGWERGRGFPDTFARLENFGGSANAQTAFIEPGVDPASVQAFFAFVSTPNTGPMALSVNGEPPREVVNFAGNPLAAGEWTGAVMFARDGERYRLLLDAGAAASAAQSASEAADSADRAETEADRAATNALSVVARAWFKTVSDLLNDNNSVIGYAGSGADFEVAPGDIIEAQGFRYEVAAGDATTFHVETAGGVRLNVLPVQGQTYNLAAFGLPFDGATDISSAMQAVLDKFLFSFRCIFVCDGDFKLNGPVRVKWNQHIDCRHKRLFTDSTTTSLFFVERGWPAPMEWSCFSLNA